MAPKITPTKGEYPDFKRDAKAALTVLKAGGVVIVPSEVGYTFVSTSDAGIEKAFQAKKRTPGHTLSVVGSYQTHKDLHALPDDKFLITKVITQDLGSLLTVTAPLRKDSTRLKTFSKKTVDAITHNGTINIAIVEGPFLEELARLVEDEGLVMIGSSANITGKGQKYRVEDIEEEIKAAADLIVDYGLQRYYRYGRAGTILDIEHMKIIRIGAAHELLRWRLKHWFNIDLPEDPHHKTHEISLGHSIKTGHAIQDISHHSSA